MVKHWTYYRKQEITEKKGMTLGYVTRWNRADLSFRMYRFISCSATVPTQVAYDNGFWREMMADKQNPVVYHPEKTHCKPNTAKQRNRIIRAIKVRQGMSIRLTVKLATCGSRQWLVDKLNHNHTRNEWYGFKQPIDMTTIFGG